MKLLFILNEDPAGSHDDIHHTLSDLKKNKVISEYKIYSFLARLKETNSSVRVCEEIEEISNEFLPDSILWSHTNMLKADLSFINRIKNSHSNPTMGYWDGDIYQWPCKRISNNVLNLAKKCDISFFQGEGKFTRNLIRKGIKNIKYVPAASDTKRFFKNRFDNNAIEYDVVMIGNKIDSLLPWKKMPGNKLREDLVEYFYKKLGNRFAVFGYGWKGKYSKGPIDFKNQHKAYHSGRIAIGNNNLHNQYYFSNRLPIAMSSGVPVVYNYESGFEKIFGSSPGIKFFNNVEEAWSISKNLLKNDQSYLDKLGETNFQFAKEKFTMYLIIEYMINYLKSIKSNSIAPNNIWLN